MKPRIAVLGGLGRLGRAILEELEVSDAASLAGVVERPGSSGVGVALSTLGLGRYADLKTVSSLYEVTDAIDAVIDATVASSATSNLAACVARRAGCVLAVTGGGKPLEEEVLSAARSVPVVVAPNLSLGAAVLAEAVRAAAGKLLGYDVEIVETHHRRKRDSPSGTALALAEAVRAGSPEFSGVSVGRPASSGERCKGSVFIHPVRGGDETGEHRVIFLGDGERLEFVHRASSRKIFAVGALRAAAFVSGKPPGMYTMSDVLVGL